MNDKKEVYLVLTKTYSIVARTIRLLSHSTYSHASLSFDKECNNMYSFGRKYYRIPIPGCFEKEDLKKGFFKNKNAMIAIYKIDVTNEQYKHIINKVSSISKNNKGYNIIGLFLAYFKIKLHRNKYYCSEFVYEVLSSKRVNIYKKKNIRFKPEDLIKDNFTKIFEGKIIDYVNA